MLAQPYFFWLVIIFDVVGGGSGGEGVAVDPLLLSSSWLEFWSTAKCVNGLLGCWHSHIFLVGNNF